MRAAIITWIYYNNYGTLLQAYALQQELNKFGVENEILFDGNILAETKQPESKSFSHKVEPTTLAPHSWRRSDYCSSSTIQRLIHLIFHPRRIPHAVQVRICKKKHKPLYAESQRYCEEFKCHYLNIFFDVHSNNINLLNEMFDIFIAGSDQIWSVFERDFNPYYFLNFVRKAKISYAPSIGTTLLPEDKAAKIKTLLSDFSAISAREQETAWQLSELLQQNVEWVADPTLLHDRQFWSSFTAGVSTLKRPYLLCYFLENKDWYFSYARRLAKQLHLSIVLLPNRCDFLSSKYLVRTGVGPKEFVSLIQHAKFVLTDSYHGSIFSLIFKRDFLYLLRFSDSDKKSQNIRIYSLFSYLNLNDRIVYHDNSDFKNIHIKNYEDINKKILALKTLSTNYLYRSIFSGEHFN